MADPDEQAAIVNALQRHAQVVVQKSLAEGFGLTVTEAMWKARPVVASAVGGIVDQIVDGEHGLLLDDPGDLASFGRAVCSLLQDPALSTGSAALPTRAPRASISGIGTLCSTGSSLPGRSSRTLRHWTGATPRPSARR